MLPAAEQSHTKMVGDPIQLKISRRLTGMYCVYSLFCAVSLSMLELPTHKEPDLAARRRLGHALAVVVEERAFGA